MAITSDSGVVAIWNKIVAVLQGEMNVGPTGPGSGSNTTGRLQSLQYVHKTIHLWSDELPAVGVQLIEEDPEPYGQRKQLVTIEFRIVVAAKAAVDSNGNITLDDAFSKLMQLIEDGNGNGVMAVLRDPANFSLGGLAMETYSRGKNKYDWDVDKAVGATDARAYAYIPYFAKAIVSY